MTKAGIVHLTKCLAVEWGKYGITVNAVATHSNPGDRGRTVRSRLSCGHCGTNRGFAPDRRTEEVAGAVVFLASPAASLITGETILIDGGWTAHSSLSTPGPQRATSTSAEECGSVRLQQVKKFGGGVGQAGAACAKSCRRGAAD